MAKIRGNHGKGFLGHGMEGVVPAGMGWVAITGEAGEKVVQQLSSIVTGDINRGTFIQSEVALEVRYTLCDPGPAASPDPAVQAGVLWTAAQNVAAGGIVAAGADLFTAMEIKFTAAGTCYVAVR